MKCFTDEQIESIRHLAQEIDAEGKTIIHFREAGLSDAHSSIAFNELINKLILIVDDAEC